MIVHDKKRCKRMKNMRKRRSHSYSFLIKHSSNFFPVIFFSLLFLRPLLLLLSLCSSSYRNLYPPPSIVYVCVCARARAYSHQIHLESAGDRECAVQNGALASRATGCTKLTQDENQNIHLSREAGKEVEQ